VNYTGGVFLFNGQGVDWRYQERLIPEQRVYAPFYFVREARVALNESGSNGEVLVVSLGSSGIGFYQRQGDQWDERPWPQIPYKDTGSYLGGWFLAIGEGSLVFMAGHPVRTDVPAILLIDLAEWRNNQ
jgi:hypothetical protein